jgi:hypothetical protein
VRPATSFKIDEKGDVAFCEDAAPIWSAGVADSKVQHDVVEAGHIWWTARERCLRICLRPSITSTQAYDRLMQWLAVRASSRVHLCWWYQNQWWHEIVGSPQLAAASVEKLFSLHGGGSDGLLRSRIKSHGAVQRMKPFAKAFELWRGASDPSDGAAIAAELEAIVGGCYVVWELNEAGDYIARRVGSGLSNGLQRWFLSNIGEPLGELPNVDLARNCERAYNEAIETFTPRADEIDTFVRWPGNSRQRVSYHRLILPFRSQQSIWLVSATVLDSAIDLFQ